jgi:MYXO-CTERM domain-containing protein
MNATFGHIGISSTLGLALLVGGTAFAGDSAPQLQVGWMVDGTENEGTLTGTGLGAGLYSYVNLTEGDGYEINWSFLVTDNGSSGGFEILASSLGVTNTSASNSTFEIDILLPLTMTPGMALYGGSMGGSLTGGENGGLLTSIDGSPLWSASVDEMVIASLGDAPFSYNTDPFGSTEIMEEAFGAPIPSFEYAAAQESMSIDMDFLLGGGDTFAITSTYVSQVPAPGAMALLGIAGLARRRRRG